MQSMKDAARENRDIRLKIEYGFTPANCGQLLMLKLASVALAGASLEPVSDSAHVLAVINETMDQIDALKESNFIDRDGQDIAIDHYDIDFRHVDFAYEKERQILKDVSFQIPEKTTTAIVGPSGSGKSTICNLLARFYGCKMRYS